MLTLTDVHAYYGKSHVLHGVEFVVGPGEIVALLGRNGSGRSTTVKAIMGLVHGTGSVNWKGQEVLGRPAFEIAHAGIGYVPENRDIFPSLTVHQNLMLGEKRGAKSPRWSFEDMYRLFPRLRERQHTEAGVLSGSVDEFCMRVDTACDAACPIWPPHALMRWSTFIGSASWPFFK